MSGLGLGLELHLMTSGLAWVGIALLVGLAAAIDIPSLAPHRSNLAPPLLLAFLVSTGSVTAWLVMAVVVVSLVHLVLARVLGRGSTWAVVGSGSCVAVAVLWIAASTWTAQASVIYDAFGGGLTISVIAILWAVVDRALRQLTSSKSAYRSNSGWAFVGDVLMLLMASGSLVIAAALLATVGIWAAVVAVIPLLVTLRLVTSLVMARRIERLALRAIGRLPEAAGLIETEHSANVEKVAYEMGRLCGLRGRKLDELRMAAVLHEVGLVSQTRLEDLASGYSRGDVARWGAEILESSHPLSSVASLVGDHAEPFRAPGAMPDPHVDARSHMIKLACEVDRLRSAGMERWELLDCLYAESKFRFSPQMIDVLRPALERVEAARDLR